MDNKQEILVSICCITYNQKDYIEKAILSFLEQKTNFKYEILIHDDCSTDGTTEIVKEYEEKYPDLIRGLYEEENQYSKRVKISTTLVWPKARGKYIALCEGDDYWCDEFKLQKQVDYMEKHEECTFCFTNGYCERNGVITGPVIPWQKESKVKKSGIYNVSEIDRLGFIPTASFMFRKDNISSLPTLKKTSFTGDNLYKLWFTFCGYAYCISDKTCVYRRGVENSATTLWRTSNSSFQTAMNRMINMYKDLDGLMSYKHHKQFNRSIDIWLSSFHDKKREYESLRKLSYAKIYLSNGVSPFCIYLVKCIFPKFMRKRIEKKEREQ